MLQAIGKKHVPLAVRRADVMLHHPATTIVAAGWTLHQADRRAQTGSGNAGRMMLRNVLPG